MRHLCGYIHPIHADTMVKCSLANTRQLGRESDFLQVLTIVEQVGRHLPERFGKRDNVQVGAITKCTIADGGNAIGKLEHRQ